LGRQVSVNSTIPATIIGVMPDGFHFVDFTDVWLPLSQMPGSTRQRRDARALFMIGRLPDGIDFDRVRAELSPIAANLAARYPDTNKDVRPLVSSLYEAYNGGLMLTDSLTLVPLLTAAFVLLIACVNVANLQIASALERRREFAVQRALGAGHARLVRLVLLEGVHLAALAAAGGVLLAWIGTRALTALLGPHFLTFWFRGRVNVELDVAALAFAVAAAVVTTLLFSLGPAIELRRAALTPALGDGGRGATRPAFGLRRVLVAAEIALAIVVLCGAGLLVRSVARLLQVDPGLSPERVLVVQASLPQPDTYGPATRPTFCEDVTRSVAAGPFEAVGAISHLPFTGANASRALSIEGRPHDPARPVNASYRLTCPGYFATLGIRMVRGRDALAADAEPVVVINRAMADEYWRDEDPVGQRLRLGRTGTPRWMRIVGVAENVRHFGLDAEPVREIFVPYRQNAWPTMTVVTRAAGDLSQAMDEAFRDRVRSAYPALPLTRVSRMTDVVGESTIRRASFMRLLLVFAGLGLGLAAVGVYAVLTWFVSQRVRELGIRVALGATRPSIVGLVLRQSLVPVGLGLIAGAVASIWTGRLLTDVLFRTEPDDPVVIASIAALVFVVGLVASWIPAHRAAGVDPIQALRR
jgi:putative ABC transport system permease protein